MSIYLDFEKSIADIEQQIKTIESLAKDKQIVNVDQEIKKLKNKCFSALKEIYKKLTPWQKTLVARHPNRPHAKDYIKKLIQNFYIFAGDRNFSDDYSIITGIGKFNGKSVFIIAQEKGHDIESRLKYNFGMAKPEGYRKAIRIMNLANRFNIPIISFVDTPGAYPGVDAEQRGQAIAIANSINTFLELQVPTIAVIIGEGGSGGAIAIAAANKVLMLEHSIYSVISPEGAAAILWRNKNRMIDAANIMKITAQDLLKLRIIDKIIAEPLGGAHRNKLETISNTSLIIEETLKMLLTLDKNQLITQRKEKFLQIGIEKIIKK